MAKMTTVADKIEANLKSAAKEGGSKRLSSGKTHSPINNLGSWAHPPKKKSKKK
jgi:hypothetical protein